MVLIYNLWWEPRAPAQADNARRLARFVSGLPNVRPDLRELAPVAEDQEASAARAPERCRGTTTPHRPNFSLRGRGRPWPELGSNISGGHAGPPPYDFRKSSYADTSCHLGQYGRSGAINPNHIFMRLSELRPSTGRPWRASDLRPLMKFARETWNPAEMCALFSFGSNVLPEIPDPSWAAGKRTLKPWIGWITYLPPDLAAQAKYPPDTHVETLDDGAALVTLCEEPFDKTDAEGMARLHALEAALRPIQT